MALWWQASLKKKLKEVFWITLLVPNLMLIVVTASMRAGALSKNKLAIPEENWAGDKTDSLGVHSSLRVQKGL